MKGKDVIALLPGRLATRIQTIRSRRHQGQYLKKTGLLRLNQRYLEVFGPNVLTGPFQGLRYPPLATEKRHVTPRLLGAYESCLHWVILEVQKKKYTRIINVGCAEGYYAVGLAMTCPDAQVFAFDAEPRELRLCRRMRDLNSVTNLILGSFCDPEVLLKVAAPYYSLILSDCEGFESQLFTADTVTALPQADFLIELHETASPGVTRRLESLLSKTHKVMLIDFSQRTLGDYPELERLGSEAELCLCELRESSQQWLYAVKNSERPESPQQHCQTGPRDGSVISAMPATSLIDVNINNEPFLSRSW